MANGPSRSGPVRRSLRPVCSRDLGPQAWRLPSPTGLACGKRTFSTATKSQHWSFRLVRSSRAVGARTTCLARHLSGRGRDAKIGQMRHCQRMILHWAQNGLCAGCGRPVGLSSRGPKSRATYPTFDHFVPKSRGGGRVLINGLLKHRRCNEGRGDRPPSGCDRVWQALVLVAAGIPGSFGDLGPGV